MSFLFGLLGYLYCTNEHSFLSGCDLFSREVPLKDAKEYAESIGAVVVETSAKNAINIEELFQGISRQIPPLDPHENGNNGAIKLGKQATQASRRCC